MSAHAKRLKRLVRAQIEVGTYGMHLKQKTELQYNMNLSIQSFNLKGGQEKKDGSEVAIL